MPDKFVCLMDTVQKCCAWKVMHMVPRGRSAMSVPDKLVCLMGTVQKCCPWKVGHCNSA
jgi:hypothetical protein